METFFKVINLSCAARAFRKRRRQPGLLKPLCSGASRHHQHFIPSSYKKPLFQYRESQIQTYFGFGKQSRDPAVVQYSASSAKSSCFWKPCIHLGPTLTYQCVSKSPSNRNIRWDGASEACSHLQKKVLACGFGASMHSENWLCRGFVNINTYQAFF